ncbi:adenylate/guanylate cyclase domain-containing protein [Ruegeria arenilitoris]|uniref:adenylate/guanylate cyclase domain-containing protein n=1 Tax=Ruegeria arenilitoris TaxID=1173585 RepID=UPI0020C5103A|nr:adenylate/guanylate cyclase domain-containing protein [Ruegeria arenilitoris]
MFKESPELMSVSRRWYKAMVARNEAELKNYLSESSELRFVGSADGELWLGPAVREAIGRHFEEVPDILDREELLAEAYESGDIGWSLFANRFRFRGLPDPVTFRTTLIFALEHGLWKIVHRHASLPSPNETSIGHKHTAIQDLLDSVEEGFNIGQAEGLASIMFTDIVNSSPIVEAIGDLAWSRLVASHFDNLRNVIEANGGEFVKSLGDGTMSSFASARAALTAAKTIQTEMLKQNAEPKLSLRVGLHTGDVVRSNDDFFGNVVNKAARVTEAAEQGEICVSDTTHAVVGADFDLSFSDPQLVSLKGLDGSHQIWLLNWRD